MAWILIEIVDDEPNCVALMRTQQEALDLGAHVMQEQEYPDESISDFRQLGKHRAYDYSLYAAEITNLKGFTEDPS